MISRDRHATVERLESSADDRLRHLNRPSQRDRKASGRRRELAMPDGRSATISIASADTRFSRAMHIFGPARFDLLGADTASKLQLSAFTMS
jgi:hypothetical protein